MIYFHSFKNPGLILDIVQDIRNLNELARKSRKAGMIILGGGVCKHQIANAMLIVGLELCEIVVSLTFGQRNGADYAVYIVSQSCDYRDYFLTPCRTLGKSLMALTRVHVLTKPFRGVKLELALSQ